MSKKWFEEHYRCSEIFETWWLTFYGSQDQYTDQDEYWIRKGFAWVGWEAAYQQAIAAPKEK